MKRDLVTMESWSQSRWIAIPILLQPRDGRDRTKARTVFTMALRAKEGPAGDSDDVLRPGLLPLGDRRTGLWTRPGVHLHGVIGSPSHRKEEQGHVGPRPRKVRTREGSRCRPPGCARAVNVILQHPSPA